MNSKQQSGEQESRFYDQTPHSIGVTCGHGCIMMNDGVIHIVSTKNSDT